LKPNSDKTLFKLLSDLKVYCFNKEKGCSWTGPRSNVQEHLERSCKFIACVHKNKGCTVYATKPDLLEHLKSCDYEEMDCVNAKEGCTEKVERRKLPGHLDKSCVVVKKKREEQL
jgi:hypothetical protein